MDFEEEIHGHNPRKKKTTKKQAQPPLGSTSIFLVKAHSQEFTDV